MLDTVTSFSIHEVLCMSTWSKYGGECDVFIQGKLIKVHVTLWATSCLF